MDLTRFNGTAPVFEGSYTAEALLNAIEFKEQTSQSTPSALGAATSGRDYNPWREPGDSTADEDRESH